MQENQEKNRDHSLLADRMAGVILGTAVGDSLGLPREGLSRRRGERIFGSGPLRHRFLFGRGMLSDDTEHACMVSQALLAAPDDPEAFARSLAWRLRGWLLGLPAGIGLGTLKSILKLWMGFPPHRSGVGSAGNGPAMRAAAIGICLREDRNRLIEYVRASSRITHRDPRAEEGALAVALGASLAASRLPGEIHPPEILGDLRRELSHPDLLRALDLVQRRIEELESAESLARDLGLGSGVTGYVLHTVPAALFCWLRWPGDFRRSLEEMVGLGGDTDTTGAIAGALAGATCGASGIPGDWISGIADWPRSVNWMRSLSAELADRFSGGDPGRPCRPVPFFWPGLAIRNPIFTAVVLLHGFRRLLPPY